MKKLRVAICYDPPKVGAGEDILDIFNQMNFVRENLLKLGHMAIDVPFRQNPEITTNNIKKYNPDILWNLFETYNGSETDHYLGAMMLDNTSIPYTGCSAQAILFCADKIIVKQILREAGANAPVSYAIGEPFIPGKWILKPKSLHGSVGIDDSSVVTVRTEKELQNAILSKPLEYNIFAEEYIEGREFSVSLIDLGRGMKAIAVAEMKFEGFVNKNKILGFDAKWTTDSDDYKKTYRSFNHSDLDAPFIDKMIKSAEIISQMLDMRGFARIDFRLDLQGRLWVIDVNPNPGLGEDTGFTAACEHVGIDNLNMINLILQAALRR